MSDEFEKDKSPAEPHAESTSEETESKSSDATAGIEWNASTQYLDFTEGEDEKANDVSDLAAAASAAMGLFADDAPAPVKAEAVVEAPKAKKGKKGGGKKSKKITVEVPLADPDLDAPTEAAAEAMHAFDEPAAESSTEDASADDVVLVSEAEVAEMAASSEEVVEQDENSELSAAAELGLDEGEDQLAFADGESEESAVEAGADSEEAETEAPEDNMSAEERAMMEAELGPEQVEFIDADQVLSIIESVLFSTDKAVSVASLKQIFKGTNIRTKDITRALDNLASEYAGSTRGVTMEEINGGFQLRTKPDNAEYLRRLAKVRPFRLSGPALEVMAIVAYKQPITKHEIDEIRGVESGHLLRALMERGLTAFGERSDLPGKPMTYVSTKKFLETFGLRNIRELPSLSEIDALLPEGIGEPEEEKETLSDLTDRMSTELTSTYSEGEDELLKINEQLQAVDTTSEFFEQEKVREKERRDRERAQDIRERLVLGEQVEEKDRRWLDRYEAALERAENPQVAPAAEGEAAAAAGADEPAPLGDALEALTAEADEAKLASGEDADEAADELLLGDEADLDDLSANADWDDDHEKEM